MYESFYKFSGKPFQLNPDPSFYFASKGHSRAFAYLKYGIYQGDGFIVITGDIGAGKTTLLRALMEEVDTDRIVVTQLVSTQLGADDLLQAVCGAFGLPMADLNKAEMLASLVALLRSLLDQGRRALLIVDEAQNLTQRAMEELRMLSNFQIGARPLLQSFLVGQPELRDIMRGPSLQQLCQRIIASYHLGPLAREEVRGYVRHRLEHVGWCGDPDVQDSIFGILFEETGGVPRAINALCNRLFLSACLDKKHSIGAADLGHTVLEMRNEFGPLQRSQPQKPVPSEHAPAAAGSNVPAARSLLPTALKARLDRIEQEIATAFGLLQEMAHRNALQSPVSDSERRARFGGRRTRTPGSV